ncbi:MAG: ABC transporter substrate-binding protein [Oscillospiraceae bacterium]|nr:ABC transporter substrate-binding protein [Oscillospiraceae bacterium]
MPVLLCVWLLLSGCMDTFFPYPYLPITPEPSPSPPPIVLPNPAPQALSFGIAFSPSGGFHPLAGTRRHNAHAARLCYEGLFELDGRFTPLPLLCETMETEDNLRFTVFLREDVLFHDGSPLTAADVVYSFTRARRPGGLYAERLSPVLSVTAQSDGTVLITMSDPVFNAAALFDFPIIRESTNPVPPGTGPYRAVLSEEGNYLLPFEGWWQHKPLPAGRIELVDAEDAGTLVYSFQYGYIAMMPADLWDTLSPGVHTGYDKISIPGALMQYIGFNTARRPLDRAQLRLAISLALDRRGALERVYGEDAALAVLPVPPVSPLYLERSAMAYRFDSGEAARMLAGVSALPELDFIAGAENAARAQMAELLAENLRSAGFAVRLRLLGREDYDDALFSGDFDLYYAEARLSPNLDPSEFLLPGGAFAFGVSESAAMREALGRLAAAEPQTGAERDALGAVWDVLAEELPMLTVCFRSTQFISQRGLLSGQTPTFFNPYAGFADWTVNER